jgi:hypothetical protein
VIPCLSPIKEAKGSHYAWIAEPLVGVDLSAGVEEADGKDIAEAQLGVSLHFTPISRPILMWPFLGDILEVGHLVYRNRQATKRP